jgi:hypothetical protein
MQFFLASLPSGVCFFESFLSASVFLLLIPIGFSEALRCFCCSRPNIEGSKDPLLLLLFLGTGSFYCGCELVRVATLLVLEFQHTTTSTFTSAEHSAGRASGDGSIDWLASE